MKKSEKLFLAINDINDEIIENAKPKEEKPVALKPAPRSPIKGVMLLAACIAVLAVGIFAIVKFKTGGDIDPVDSDSTGSSEEGGDSSDDSDQSSDNNSDQYIETEHGLKIPITFTEEDRELQEILKGMKAGVEDLNKLFIKRADGFVENKYFQNGADAHGYYLIPENKKTGPNNMFDIPQTRDGLEKLLLEYFSANVVEKFMSEVNKATAVETTKGTFITLEDREKGFSKFIEVDGRMCCDAEEYGMNHYMYGTWAPPYYMLCDTAKVKSKTDDTIYFSYISSYSNVLDPWTDYKQYEGSFSNIDCSLKFERGGWKLNYYYNDDNIYSNMSSSPPQKTMDDVEDHEIFDILKPLIDNFEEVTGLFSEMHTYNEGALVKFECRGNSFEETFFRLSAEQRTEPNGSFAVPLTYNEMEELLLRYLTPQAAASYMNYVGKGTLTENSDGSYTLEFEDGYEPTFPTFVEIDGSLYRNFRFDDRKQIIDPYSAKLTSKTDNTIEFTYEHTDSYDYTGGTKSGFLVNDGSGWKMNYNKNYGFMPVFTEEDHELQDILTDLAPGGELIAGWVGYGCGEPYYDFYINGSEYVIEYSLLPIGKTPDGKIEYPQTLEELEELMLQYLTQELVDAHMKGACKGTMTENPDGTYSVSVEDDTDYHDFIEIDGRIYVQDKARGGAGSPVWDTAKIIEKTGDHIKFSYTHDGMMGYYPDEGLIRYERGGWRLSYSWRGFVLD